MSPSPRKRCCPLGIVASGRVHVSRVTNDPRFVANNRRVSRITYFHEEVGVTGEEIVWVRDARGDGVPVERNY
ncbi:unnamed protein product [Calypogeia fissa]